MISKNKVILALIVLVFIGSIGGSIADKKKWILQDALTAKTQEHEKVVAEADLLRHQLSSLRQTLAERERQVSEASSELPRLREINKSLEAQLSIRMAALAKVFQEKKELLASLGEGGKSEQPDQTKGLDNKLARCEAELNVAEKKNAKLKTWLETLRKGEVAPLSVPESMLNSDIDTDLAQDNGSDGQESVDALRTELAQTRQAMEKVKHQMEVDHNQLKREQDLLGYELNTARAQVIGLEKMIEEKDQALEKSKKEMEQIKVNMDVLLARISEQNSAMVELQENTKELLRTLSDKNNEIATLQDKLLKSPVN